MKKRQRFLFSGLLLFCLAVFHPGWVGAEPREAVAQPDLLPTYDLTVVVEPEKNRIEGTARIRFPAKDRVEFSFGKLHVFSMSYNGTPMAPGMENGPLEVLPHGSVEIVFEGIFPAENARSMPPVADGSAGNLISANGVSLINGWYPQIGGLASYQLKATVPSGMVAVSEADEIRVDPGEGRNTYTFLFPYPADGITLSADRYEVREAGLDGMRIYTYFIEKENRFSGFYLDQAKRYFREYSALLGPCPYKRFSIVENVLPTGCSMPTLTLLGREVLRLPFVAEISLAHEILHQWFGVAVSSDAQNGNWAEGLTTYLADHFIDEQRQQGWKYRKGILSDYQSYVHPDRGKALRSYTGSGQDRVWRAVGYGKGAMVFHMLRLEVGDEAFFDALRNFLEQKIFQKASWADLQAAFEQVSGRSLGGFFAQWLDRPDIPALAVLDPRVTYRNGEPTVSFTLAQRSGPDAEPFSLDVLVEIATQTGDMRRTVHLDKAQETFSFPVSGTPVSLTLDPDYDLMRSLCPGEFPPALSRFLGDENRLVVLPGDREKTCFGLVEVLGARGIPIKSEKDIRDADIASSSLFLLDGTGAVCQRLFGKASAGNTPPSSGGAGISRDMATLQLSVRKNPLNPAKVVVVADCASDEQAGRVAEKLFHYGKYSTLVFEGDLNVEKNTMETQRGIRKDLSHRVLGVRPAQTLDMNGIVRAILDKPVIYLGESHSDYEDHKVQLEVIRSLHEGGHRFAIGMEMFQLPFQKALDDYLSGNIGEKEFLKKTEYFDRWRFDYQLYREIINYSKAKGIPVIALNTDARIISKVARGGLDALSEAEREQIPVDMDMSNEAYRHRLGQVFQQQQHEEIEKMSFENFYQAQVLWDETMAHAVQGYLKEHPDYQMVVLAGTGHLMYGSGIPDRVRRLTGKDHAILINANIPEWGEAVADFVLFPEPLVPPESPKLGVFTVDGEDGLVIQEVVPHGVAADSGLEKGDVIVSIDGDPVRTIGDVKIALLDRQSGDCLKIRVKRKKFPGGKKEQDIPVTLR